jgi:hypothetical protein
VTVDDVSREDALAYLKGRGVSGADAASIYRVAGGRIGLLSHIATSVADMGIDCEGDLLIEIAPVPDTHSTLTMNMATQCNTFRQSNSGWNFQRVPGTCTHLLQMRADFHFKCMRVDMSLTEALHSVVEAAADEFKVAGLLDEVCFRLPAELVVLGPQLCCLTKEVAPLQSVTCTRDHNSSQCGILCMSACSAPKVVPVMCVQGPRRTGGTAAIKALLDAGGAEDEWTGIRCTS